MWQPERVRRVEVDGWAFVLPERLVGGQLRHGHSHIDVMARYSIPDEPDLEVIVTTYPGPPMGERGQALDDDGAAWTVPGATKAIRRDQVTQLDDDPHVPPVHTTLIVATASTGSVCLVVHRPLDAPSGPTEAVACSLKRVSE